MPTVSSNKCMCVYRLSKVRLANGNDDGEFNAQMSDSACFSSVVIRLTPAQQKHKHR